MKKSKLFFATLLALPLILSSCSAAKDGATPRIGENGNWWIGETDTGVKAAGQDGKDGKDGADGKDGQNGQDGKDGLNGKDGADGKDGQNGVGILSTEINEDGELIVTYTNGEVVNLGHVYEDKVELNYYRIANFETEPELLATEYHERGEVINLPKFESNPFKGYENIKWYANLHGGELVDEANSFEWRFEEEYGYFANQLVYDVNNLYGLGIPKEYIVSYDLNDDVLHPATAKDNDTVKFGQAYEIKAAERTGYNFVKWVQVPEKYEGKLEDLDAFELKGNWSIDDNVKLTAVWAIKTQKITWMNGKEEIYNEQVAYFETPAYNPEYVIEEGGEELDPVLAGIPQKESTIDTVYKFDGWSLTDGGDRLETLPAVDKDAVYYAHFKESVREYTITFLNDDAEHTEIYHVDVAYGDTPAYDPEHVIVPGEEPVLAGVPVKEKTAQYTYTFAGWQLDEENKYPVGEDLPKVKGDATFTAYFSATVNEYKVTFVDEDGLEILQQSDVAYGTAPVYTAAMPHKKGDEKHNYYFYGWTDGTETYPVDVEEFKLPEVTGAVTYKAVYEVLDDVDNFEFQYQEATESYIITKYVGEANDVVIPSTYLEKPISAIGSSAFAANKTLAKVAFRPDSQVKSIDASAFAADEALKEVVLPDSLEQIGASAFAVCSNLKTLTIGHKLSKLNAVAEGAFALVNGLTINYYGTEEMFAAISVAEMNNEGFKNATVNYLSAGEDPVDPDPVDTVTTVTFVAKEQNYENAQAVESWKDASENPVVITFDKGTNSNAPKYYSSGEAIRMYGGNSMNIFAPEYCELVSISIEFSSGEGTNAITASIGDYADGEWTADDPGIYNVTFNVGGTSGHRRIASVEVSYQVAEAL